MRFCVLAFAFACAINPAQAQNRKAKPGWLADYETGRALARKTGKPLMVVFRCEP